MNRLLGFIIYMLLSFNVFALGNPGESAEDCVAVSAAENGGKTTIKNTCSEEIFVIWCVTSASGQDRHECGPKAGNARYYTETLNLNAAREVSWQLSGEVHYAACKGQTGDSSPAQYFEDDGAGGYKCKRTGDYGRIGLKEDTSIADNKKAAAELARKTAKFQAEYERTALAEKKAQAAKGKAGEAAAEEKSKKECAARYGANSCLCTGKVAKGEHCDRPI